MRVAFDENGYAYDTETGNLINLGYDYDEDGNLYAFDTVTGERVEEVITDAWGGTVFTGRGGFSINHALDVAAQAYAAGEGAAQSGHYIPTQGSQSQQGYRTTGAGGGVTVTGGAGRGGLGAGLNISTNTLILIAAGVLLFMSGRGRR